MKKNLTFIFVLFSVVLFVFLGIVLGRYTSRTLVAEAPNPACMSTMTDIIVSAQGDVYNMGNDPDYVEPESHYLATYSVHGDAITDPVFESVPNDLKDEQKDSALQNQAWKIFTDLIPPGDRQMVVQYNVFTDGFETTLAAVDQTKSDPSDWILEIDIADLEDKDALMFTMIHEYAHLLTLNASQVTPDREIVNDPYNLSLQTDKAAACPNYFTGTGCSHADSYVHAFYNRFWVDINDEWAKVDALQYETEDLTPYYDGLYSFYKTHQDQFLDDYSTTHPTEDIAEAFAYFVFSPKPTGISIKEQKIAFFFEYPELVRLREDILNGACSVK
ncbi:MAG: hypothetical protein HY863_15860 [Chloroflexi bacterium]|nr:hypothetical protein [Chloroflexota bacterium]